jgi:two-component system, cell cycle sensor histidine kinase and response regulator CckA
MKQLLHGPLGFNAVTFPGWASKFSIGTAMLVLISWVLGWPGLAALHPRLGTMEVYAALCFILTGSAFLLLMEKSGAPWKRRLGAGLAALVIFLSILSLLDSISTWDSGLNRLLARAHFQVAVDADPMPWASAIIFTLLGLSLLLLDTPIGRFRFSQLFALMSFFFPVLAIASFSYVAVSFVAPVPQRAMGVHSLISFLLLSGGVLLARPDSLLIEVLGSQSVSGAMARRLLPVAILAPIFLGWLTIEILRARILVDDLALALLALSNAILSVLVVWRTARSLHGTEARRQQAELALHASEKRYRILFERHPQPMWVYDLDSLAFLAVNRAAIQHYGYSREEFLGMTTLDVWPAEEVPALLQGLKRGFPREFGHVWKHRKKNGTLIDVEEIGHELMFGDRRACLAVARDITDRKHLEDQLRQAQKMEAIGRLAGGVAHDFNNVLTAILGYSELLLGNPASAGPAWHSGVVEIRKAAEKAASLTKQLLAFSRQQVLETSLLDLNSVVSSMAGLLRRLIGEDIDLQVRLAPKLGWIKAAQSQIEQIVLNLAVNARDAMPSGGELTIETADSELDEIYAQTHVAVRPGSYVMLAVSDTGVGMSAEVQSHIFEPFFTTKEVGKGTGLGLSTIYGAVKQNGGHISFYSEIGRGTTFKVYLPQAEVGGVPQDLDPQITAVGGKETILVVEDDETVRQLASETLVARGYRVLVSKDTQEALQLSEKHAGPIDLLLTDVVMPGLSGPELAKQVLSLRPQCRVLLMSGYAGQTIIHRGVIDGASAFLQKPFTPSALGRRVREILDHSSSTRSIS